MKTKNESLHDIEFRTTPFLEFYIWIINTMKIFWLVLLFPFICLADGDLKPFVLRVMGIRHIEAVAPDRIRLEIGASATGVAGEARAYRIISSDDPAYRYENFVTPLQAFHKKETELALPEKFQSNASLVSTPLTRTLVELTLPTPMKPGKHYAVVAQGVGDRMVTAAKTGAEFVYEPDKTITAPPPLAPRELLETAGLRRLSSVGNKIILLEFGHAFAAEPSILPTSYKVRINAVPCKVLRSGRRSTPDLYLPEGWPYKAFQQHDLFLELERPLRNGDRVEVTVADAVTTGNRVGTLHFDHKTSYSSAIKVNQIGYLIDGPKNGYLGRWLGSFPEQKDNEGGNISADLLFDSAPAPTVKPDTSLSPSALRFDAPPEFELVDVKSGQTVFRKRAELRHNGRKNDGKINHSGENVYLLDFSEFKTPGRYFIAIAGVGRSFDFAIGTDVYKTAFEKQSHGIFIQRCGQKLEEPFSDWKRIACHTAGVVPTTEAKYEARREWGDFRNHQLMVKNPDYPSTRQKELEKDASLIARFSGKDLGKHKLDLIPQKGFTLLFDFTKGNDTEKYDGKILMFDNLGIAVNWGLWRLEYGRDKQLYKRIGDGHEHRYLLTFEPLRDKLFRARLYADGVLAVESVGNTIPKAILEIGKLTREGAETAKLGQVLVFDRLFSADEIKAVSESIQPEIPERLAVSGGHHDAGDYNPRSHLDVAQVLMDAYETAPQKFSDNQLNIPERNNGIPDILDEALWALKIWIGLQREDGAVYHGTESAGDPNFIQTVELDNKGDFAWAPDGGAAFQFAGAMAQASRLLRPFRSDLADDYLKRARKAYLWASENKPPIEDLEKGARYYIAPRAYAAAQLYHTTGEENFNRDFLANTPWKKRPKADMMIHKRYDLSNAAYSYANLPDKLGDFTVKRAVREAIRREADSYIKGSSEMAYRFIRHPYAPINWGTGAYANFAVPVWQAWRFTGQKKYRDWLIFTADNTLGANPLNLSWITGAGERTIRVPLHNSRYRPAGVAADGLQAQGPDAQFPGYSCRGSIYPASSSSQAVLYNFADMGFAIAMDEGTTSNMVRSMALFGLLMPENAKAPKSH